MRPKGAPTNSYRPDGVAKAVLCAPTTLYQDNTAAAALSRNVRFLNRSKHINLCWCYVAERQLLRDVDVVSIR